MEPIEEELVPYGYLQLARTCIALVLIVGHEFGRIPIVKKLFKAIFSDTIPLKDVPGDVDRDDVEKKVKEFTPPSFINYLLVLLTGLELLAWTIVFGDSLSIVIHQDVPDQDLKRSTRLSAGMILVWLRLLLGLSLRRPLTIPWTALGTYIALCATSFATLCVAAYDRYVSGTFPAWATQEDLILETCNLAITLILSLTAGALRFNSPLTLARAGVLGNDDVVTFWQWITFSWMNPFIAFASKQELETSDLPPLSRTMQTAIVFDKFKATKNLKLLWRIMLVNHLDITIDLSLTMVSVFFNYLGPYFLKQILLGIATKDDGKNSPAVQKEGLASAYVFAMLAFAAAVAKAISDLLHLWHGRRGYVRVKAQLTSAIYYKALRRKDASGVVASKEDEEDTDAKKDKGGKDKDAKKEVKKSNADTGKVVNLMSTDAGSIASTIGYIYFIVSSPVEVLIASAFLYSLLGWSAFAGIIVLAVATPLNSYVSNRSLKIYKDMLKARDKRISVMNELIGAITFIKFFAWTDKWKKRAVDARNNELKQEVRSIINGLYFSLLWSLVPILVTLCSFFCYIVIAKQELTVAVAFTSISLFSMLRMPLNAIPTFLVWILQSLVSIGRIDDFLKEEEVPDWVSSLKRKHDMPDGPTKIAFERATLRWNTGAQPEASTNGESATNSNSTQPTEGAETSSTAVSTEEVFELSNVNVEFPLGKLSVVTGPTGAGKTAMLIGLLGEMDLVEGKTFLPKYPMDVDVNTGLRNSIAYCAQTPWLQQQSIKDNILFGEQLDEDRYEAVVDACALRTDFDILEDGDQTEIGAKGVSLSGGQKARVALARAVYSYTQHVLLDDPLAAVDSHTAKHLVDKCLNGPLLKGRTVILVSHHLDLLVPSADYIVRILDGRVDCQGTCKELRSSGQLDGIVAVEEATAHKHEPVEAEDVVEAVESEEADKKKEKKKGPARKLIQDEERAVGNVKLSTYLYYIKAATWITWAIWAVILVLSQGASVAESLWLKFWGEAYKLHVDSILSFFHLGGGATSPEHHFAPDYRNNFIYHTPQAISNSTSPGFVVQGVFDDVIPNPPASTHPIYYLTWYTVIVLLGALISVLSSMIGSWSSYRASKTIHNQLLDSVLGGTIRFFNTTPLGRILNRFSKDVETIDSGLGSMIRTMVTMIASLIARLWLVVYVIPQFIFPALLISFVYFQYSVVYLRTGRSLRRLEATLRSPIFSGFSELLDGVISVRAFGVERRFFEKLCNQVDLSHSAHYYYWMTNRWLLLRFDVLGGASVFLTTMFVLRSSSATDGSAGVAITSAQSFVMSCYWLSRFWGELEMSMNSVERVEEYLDVPQEPPAVIEGHRPPAYWPSYSSNETFIRAEELEIKYSPELPTVFKGSFEIKAGEKIGLIGRTGSGKSTLAMSLLRFTDPASGKLILDGIDITTIGVDDLRSRITYIPQDAVLFSGTVRDNLDPFNEHTDAELLDALARVRLITTEGTPARSGVATPSASTPQAPTHPRLVAIAAENAAAQRAKGDGAGSTGVTPSATPRAQITLSSDVSAGGANFSQGQRQLVAMARALLRRSNLIIMDEATASVDFATDEAIQVAIRSEFKESTLLTIAHRLSSVIDYDRLLVLADGTVAEFDTPMNLLRKETSLFKSLCEKSGKYKELYQAAEKKEKENERSAPSGSGSGNTDESGDAPAA